MAETITGGAFLAADGVSWHDADGRPLDVAQIAIARALLDAQQADKAELERIRAMAEAANNPIAQALQQAISSPRKRAVATEVKG